MTKINYRMLLCLLFVMGASSTVFAQWARQPGISAPGATENSANGPRLTPSLAPQAAPVQAEVRQTRGPVPVDRIVVVVNNEVITMMELLKRMDLASRQLQKQGTQMPSRDVLAQQMLERLIMDKVQVQHARETGLRVDDAQLDQAIQRIAASNKMSVAQFRQTLEKDGVSYAQFRDEIRDEMTISRVREREVESKLIISEGEIDNYLSGDTSKGGGEEYNVSHILMRAPEAASPEQLQKLKIKADQALERLRKGEDFAKIAAAFSDAPDALQGGNLGMRPLSRLPGIFAEAVVKMQVGEVSPLMRSSNGFHIMKLLAKGSASAAPSVQQTHARHILIRVDELVSESEARHKIEGLADRIKHGAKFAEIAKLNSQDGSAPKGGDLGWVYPGDTVPEFERAMNQLKIGEVSGPVQTPFGFHLIEVQERRVQDVSSDRQRAAARQVLKERKIDEAYQDWLRQARDRAYIEIRLEER